MNDVLIPYAKLIEGGRLVTVDEVESGLACNCICDCCGATMVARKGESKVHHFGHAPKSTNDEKPCTFNFKRGCFWLIKQILEENIGASIELPDYDLTLKNNLARHQKIYQVTKASAPNYDQLISFELSAHNDTAIAMLKVGKHKLRLVFGFPYLMKSPCTTGDNCAEVFVSLANVFEAYTKERKPFIQIIKSHIFSAQYKEWLFHPRQLKYVSMFDAICDEITSELKRQNPIQFQPKKKRMHQPSSPPFQYQVVKPKKEVSGEAQDIIKYNARLDEMINAAATLYSVLKQSKAKHCDSCQFLYMVTNSTCPTCGHHIAAVIHLDDEYFKNLAQKYVSVGYVDLSLKNHHACSKKIL
ncbi:MAG: hypothetical protein LAT53_11755 [Idiomarina sp.]|nr:hypothetical protein [Idiomarina sp.]